MRVCVCLCVCSCVCEWERWEVESQRSMDGWTKKEEVKQKGGGKHTPILPTATAATTLEDLQT